MKTRDYYIASSQSLADSGSLSWPLTGLGKIGHIRVKLSATNGATSNTVGKLKSLVSKIEVLDGSNVICSVSGRELFAIDCFCNRTAPAHDMSGGAGVVTTDELVILFGRYQGDRDFYLDTSMFKNPVVKLTWAYTVSATAGIATGTGAVSLIAKILEDGAPPYKGFIMRKEIDSYTSAASGDHITECPLDFPTMGIYLAALKTTVEPDTILTPIKLTRDYDRFIDFNLTGRDAFNLNYELWPNFRQKFRPLVDTSFTWLGDLYFKTGAVMTRPGATAKGLTTAVAAESVTGFSTTGGTADAVETELNGWGPGAAVYFPLYTPDGFTEPNPDDFLNPAGLGDLRLVQTNAVVSGAVTVVVEQLHT